MCSVSQLQPAIRPCEPALPGVTLSPPILILDFPALSPGGQSVGLPRHHDLPSTDFESTSSETVVPSCPVVSCSWPCLPCEPPVPRARAHILRPSSSSSPRQTITMEDFVSESDSEYTSYWRDWVRSFWFCFARTFSFVHCFCSACLFAGISCLANIFFPFKKNSKR